jgi:putative copper export protein
MISFNPKRIVAILLPTLLFLPMAVSAGLPSLIVCDGPDCNFAKFMEFLRSLITFLIYLSIPLAAVSFAYAGFLLISSGGSEEKKNKAKSVFTKTAIGFIFILAAWLIVYAITSVLLKDDELLNLVRPGA